MNGMRTRKIVKIDEDKCDGCGVCVPSCAEGAIGVIDGKARLLAENLCDGLGNCLGTCPKGAIIIEERPAEEFDEEAVKKAALAEGADGAEKALPNCGLRIADYGLPSSAHVGASEPAWSSREVGSKRKEIAANAAEIPQAHGQASGGQAKATGYGLPATGHGPHGSGGCPGTRLRQLSPAQPAPGAQGPVGAGGPAHVSRLGQWPVQLSLVPVAGAIWQDADVLIAGDCVGFALPDFHERLLAGKTLVIACPKLDNVEPYVAKLAKIFADNAIRSITVAHMAVPCCGGIVRVVHAAMAASGRTGIRVTDITVGIDGAISSVQ